MKICIIGCGAVGLYYGARLQKSGADVHYLLRGDFDAVKSDGIRVKAPDGNFHLPWVNAHRKSSQVGVCDLVIVALKATANNSLQDLISPMMGESSRVLTLQNGLESDTTLANLFGAGRVLGGLCFVCLNRTSPGVVENFHLGSVAIGNYRKEADVFLGELAELFEKSGVECKTYDDLRFAQWKKLVWNVPFNGLAIAAGGVTTDVILESENLRKLAKFLMDEIIDAAAALGMEIKPGFADYQIEITYPMKAYKPSSLIDFLDGRPVEVEAIWGEALRQGQAAGVAMPRLEMLYGLLRAVCSKS
ncbi:2-dehydropantoate 2-reductase [Puniceicoccaceae bacterium K14]|nr:2-dehydropantoate 2-reductase [Puniceicoccaceae bacterium K14]